MKFLRELMNRFRVLGAVCAVLLSAQSASAQDLHRGFAVNRYEPTSAGEWSFWVDHPWYSQTRYFAAGITLNYGHNPLVFGAVGSDGSFTLENVPVMRNGDAVTLEVSYMRPDRAIDRTQRTPVSITANTTTSLGADIVLPGRLSPTQPLLIAPPRLTVNESQTLDFGFVALSQPVGQSVQVTTTGVGFASVSSQGNGDYSLRLAPGGNSQGEYIVLLTATNGAGEKYLHTIAVRVRRPPTNAPTANDISVITSAGTARNITLSASDPLGRQMNLPQLSSPSGGTITGSNPNLIYTPRAGVSGLDSFTYRAVVIGTAIQSDTSFVYVIIK